MNGSIVTSMAALAALSLLPFAAVMLTCFSKMAVVLSLGRSALGSQQAPPTVVLTGLAVVLTAHVMAPTAESIYERVRRADSTFDEDPIGFIQHAAEPLKDFLGVHASEEERARFARLQGVMRGEGAASDGALAPGAVADDLDTAGTASAGKASDALAYDGAAADESDAEAHREEDGWAILIPAFAITELGEAFQIGFLIFLPFLVLDMVVANVLLALGMQTLPPSQVSLPFKVLLFVAVDGWGLLSEGLVLGYRGLS